MSHPVQAFTPAIRELVFFFSFSGGGINWGMS